MRIALTSGLAREQVAADLSGGPSMFNKRVTAYRDTRDVRHEDMDLARENERLRREKRILEEEREPKKSNTVFCEPEATMLQFIHGAPG